MNNSAHLVGGWLTDLANLAAGGTPVHDAKAKIAAMAAVISEDFPPQAFTRQSLIAVSRKCKFFPSYSELHEALDAWWKEWGAKPPALPGPGGNFLPDEDRHLVANWQKHRAGDWGKAKDGTLCSGSAKRLRFELELIRKSHPEAFQWLVANDDEAGRIAALEGWLSVEEHWEPTEEERDAVRLCVKEAVVAIRTKAIHQAVPNAGQISLEEERAAAREKFRQEHGRYPGELRQEHLLIFRGQCRKGKFA